MIIVNGIDKNYHTKIHKQLKNKFGKADHCESSDCNLKSKKFNWALRKGKTYSENKDDYIQLCVSCHRKYDFTEGIRSKLKAKKVGELHNMAKLSENKAKAILLLVADGMKHKDIAEIFSINPSTVSDIKRGKRWPHLSHQPSDNESRLLEALEEDIYPESVFHPLTDKELAFISERGNISIDRLSAHYGRIFQKIFLNKLKQALKQ